MIIYVGNIKTHKKAKTFMKSAEYKINTQNLTVLLHQGCGARGTCATARYLPSRTALKASPSLFYSLGQYEIRSRKQFCLKYNQS